MFALLKNAHFIQEWYLLADILGGFRTYSPDENNQDHILARALAIADMKFTYVVSCQVYGIQKKSTEARDRSCYTNILNLMLK